MDVSHGCVFFPACAVVFAALLTGEVILGVSGLESMLVTLHLFWTGPDGYMRTVYPTNGSFFSNMSSISESRKFNQMRGQFLFLSFLHSLPILHF